MTDAKTPLVVIVEDSATQAQQIAAYLSERDVNVMVAPDGPQGLRLVANSHPDLVVLDINLPTMNGYQVCRRLKRDPETADIPVIMLTSATEAADMMKGIEVGAIDYIPKDQFAVDHLLLALTQMGILKGSS
jgi:two-component system alkaline phosphatase synthesis response regulator PhoP